MAGMRVTNIPLGTTEKDLKIYFSNPKNGGGKVSRIYYPLPGNDAVVIFHDAKVVAKVFSGSHGIKGKMITLKALPRKVFAKVTVELDQQITQLLDENSSFLDELQFDGDLEVTFDSDSMNYIMSGDWYQIEWARAYLDNVCTKVPKLNTPSRSNPTHANRPETPPDITENEPKSNDIEQHGKDKQRRKIDNPVCNIKRNNQSYKVEEMIFESNTFGSENLTDQGSLNEEKKEIQQNIPYKMSDCNIKAAPVLECKPSNRIDSRQLFNNDLSKSFIQFTTDRKQEVKNLFARRGKTSPTNQNTTRKSDPYENADDVKFEPAGAGWSKSHSLFSDRRTSFSDDDDNWLDSNQTAFSSRYNQFTQRPPFARRQQGMAISQSDFGDIPLTLEILVDSVKVLVMLGDIIEETTDAIVNPCSTDLSNTYGISKAIAFSAGFELQEECRKYISKKGHLVFGDVIHTCAGGTLHKRVGFVVHAAGPTWRDDQNEQSAHILTCTYLNCLQYANKQLWLRSISLPLISAGAYGCPLDVSVQAFYDALLLHVTDDKKPRHLQEIHLVSNDPDSTCAIIVVLKSLMDLDQIQSRNAALERYQIRSVQYEFTAYLFDIEGESPRSTEHKDERESDIESEKDDQRRDADDRHRSDADDSDIVVSCDKKELNDDSDRDTTVSDDDGALEDLTSDKAASKPVSHCDESVENASHNEEAFSDGGRENRVEENYYDDDMVPVGVIDVTDLQESDKSESEGEFETTATLDKQVEDKSKELTGDDITTGFGEIKQNEEIEEHVAKVSLNQSSNKSTESTE